MEQIARFRLRLVQLKRLADNRFVRPWAVIFGLCALLLLFNLYLVQHFVPYTSDDVSWQTILLSWTPFNGHRLYLGGSDNYILRAPLLALLGHILAPGRRALFVESYILELGNFTLVFLAATYFLRRLKSQLGYGNLLPLVWLASFSMPFTMLFLNSNLRSFEVGVSFLFLAMANELVRRREAKPTGRQWLLIGLSALLAGGFIYNDPYFLYFAVLPIGLLFVALYLLKQISWQRLALALGWCVAALAIAATVSRLVAAMGIVIPYADPLEFVSYDRLYSNIALAIHGVLLIFGADFFGEKVFGTMAVSAVLNFLLLVAIGWLIHRTIRARRNNTETANLWIWAFGMIGTLVVLIYTASTLALDLTTYRYFVMLVLACVMLLVVAVPKLPPAAHLVLVVLILLATLGNIGASLYQAQQFRRSPPPNRANSGNYAVIDALKRLGLSKGYGSYWDGDINTYLSGGRIQFLPVVCQLGHTQPYYWLIDSANFHKVATSSFYLIDPSFPSPPVCSRSQLLNQFGLPSKDLTIAGIEILVYPYDLQQRM